MVILLKLAKLCQANLGGLDKNKETSGLGKLEHTISVVVNLL